MAEICSCHGGPYIPCSYPGGCGSPGGCCAPKRCPCGRKDCDSRDPLCVLCSVLRPGRSVEHTDRPLSCGTCRVRLAAVPGDIAVAYGYLGWLLLRPESGKSGDGRAASPDPALPFPVDAHDLLGDWDLPQGPRALERLGANAVDQLGHVPARATLSTWARDWADRRGLGERGPADTVPAMARWLAERTDWACSEHPAVDSYADELQSLRGTLHAMVGRPEPDERPVPLPGVPCPRCSHVCLVRRADGKTECGWEDCRSVFDPADWDRNMKAKAKRAAKTHKRVGGEWVPREDVTQ